MGETKGRFLSCYHAMTKSEAASSCGISFCISEPREDPPDNAVCHACVDMLSASLMMYISNLCKGRQVGH